MTINLQGTPLAERAFAEIFEHVTPFDPQNTPPLDDPLATLHKGTHLEEWLHFSTNREGLGVYCHVEDQKFIGVGSAQKLERILEIFFEWAGE